MTDPDEIKENQEPTDPEIPVVKDSELKQAVKEMPQVVQEAVDASETKQNEQEQIQKTAVDNKGRAFNSNEHEIDPKTGEPLKTATGRFKRKKLNVPHGTTQQQGAAAPAVDEFSQQAKEFTVLIITLTAVFVAEEAQPTDDEFNRMKIGFEGVFRKYGCPQVGCEFVLATSIGTYMGSRLIKPKKPTPVYVFIKNWVIGLFSKKTDKKEGENVG